MTEKDALKSVRKTQTFSDYTDKGVIKYNEYNGLDKWSMGHIKDGRIYAVVPPKIYKKVMEGEELHAEFFFDQMTFDKYVDPKTGSFDASELGKALQVKPYQDLTQKRFMDGRGEYRNSVLCFDFQKNYNEHFKTPVSVCEANTQFGGGGANQAYINKDVFVDLQKKGLLKVNKYASLYKTGKNYIIDKTEYNKIDSLSQKRVKYCIENKKDHPNKKLRDEGFAMNEKVGGTPFDKKGSTGPKKKSLSDLKADVSKKRESMPSKGTARPRTPEIRDYGRVM